MLYLQTHMDWVRKIWTSTQTLWADGLIKVLQSLMISLSWDHVTFKFCFNSMLKRTVLIKSQSCHHIETNQLICRANHMTGFYAMATLVFNELTYFG